MISKKYLADTEQCGTDAQCSVMMFVVQARTHDDVSERARSEIAVRRFRFPLRFEKSILHLTVRRTSYCLSDVEACDVLGRQNNSSLLLVEQQQKQLERRQRVMRVDCLTI